MSFDRFWSAYPRHVAKGAAIKSWEKLKPDEEMVFRVCSAIAEQKRNRWQLEELNTKLPERQQKFIPDWPHPATWLNQARWDDEIKSISEARAEKVSQVEMCACGAKAFDRKQCARCYTKAANPGYKIEIEANLRKMGFTKSKDESWKDASLRCLQKNGLMGLLPQEALDERAAIQAEGQ